MTFVRWLRSLVLRRRLEGDMQEEMRQHVELATERLMARGLSHEEARRAALREFGNVHYLQETARDVRGARWLGSLSPDTKLAFRMLIKNPLLSVVGGFGMAVAICIAIGLFTWMSFYYSAPPIEGGERVVTAEYIDGDVSETTLFDYVAWKDEVTTLEDLAAYRRGYVVVESDRSGAASATLAEMTASGFRLARVPPLLGRPLLGSDELEGAAPVVVIGFDEWQQRFGGDPGVIGAQLLLDGEPHTVVGVMPDGFRFPGNQGLWTALRTDVAADRPSFAELAFVFGRLAPGVDAEAAEAELTAIGERMAAQDSRNRQRFQLVVVPFIRHLLDVQQYPPWLIWLAQLFAALILLLVAVNVAVLVYARTALRTAEITVRTALGASRGRIVSQLFLEAFVLSLASAALGLAMAQIGFRQMTLLVDLRASLPYWLFGSLPLETVLYAVGLAALAAFVVGVLPALQATGARLQSTLRQLGGGTGLRMGRTWTALICVQVAVAVGILPAVLGLVWNRAPPPIVNYPEEDILTFRTPPPPEGSAAARAEYVALREDLLRRVEDMPGVVGVGFSSGIPIRSGFVRIELDGADDASPLETPVAASHRVDPGFLDLLQVPLLAGRGLDARDASERSTAVVVTRAFAERFLDGGDALGGRFRESQGPGNEVATDAPWFEIVGIAEDPLTNRRGPTTPGVFHASELGSGPLLFVARTRGIEPVSLAAPLRTLVDEVGLGRGLIVMPMEDYFRQDRGELAFLLTMVGLVTLSVLLLSAAGISAMMSFAVTRRQREIGVRTALGATRGQLIASIFRRSTGQLGVGVALGIAVAVLLDTVTGGAMLGGETVPLVTVVCAIMLLSGLMATVSPARRALGLQAMELLRDE